MGAPYRTYTNMGSTMSACNYYRQALPISMMEKMGLPIVGLLDRNDATFTAKDRMVFYLESDFSLFYQATGEQPNALMEMGKQLKPMKDDMDIMRWPPTFVVDTDDDIFNVMPLNITYGNLGTRRWDGEPLEDGNEVGLAHPNEIAPHELQDKLNTMMEGPLTGAKLTLDDKRYVYDSDGLWHNYFSLWRDGENINISGNKQRLDNWKKTLCSANLITVSTPNVESAIRRELPDSNLPIFVTPNAIDFSMYEEIDLRDHPNEVRILWEGSATHHEGLWPLNKTLTRVAEKYPQTTWYFFGAPYKWATQNLPEDRVKMIAWCDYEAYKLRLGTIGHDINLAPLAMNTFNNSRSAIRWYENSAIWKPAATIAQRWGAYRDEIEEGKTGLLFDTPDELETKLGGLIEDAQLRQTLASNSKDWVNTHRDARKVMIRLFHKWSEVREQQKLTMPPEEAKTKEEPVANTI